MDDYYDGATQQCSQPDNTVAKSQVSVSVDPDVFLVLSGVRGTTERYELKPRLIEGTVQREWTFGRGKDAHYKLATSKRRISQVHFCIWATGDEPPVVMIHDNSTNGTFVNGIKLQKGKNSMLVHGDTISVGLGVPEDEIEFVCLFSREARQPASEGISAKYQLADLIGSGAFAKVRLAVERSTGKKFAIKMIEKSRIHGNVAVEREIDVLKRLRHNNIVGLHDFESDDNFYYLVMEYVPEGDLMAQVEKLKRIPEDVGREMLKQILEAIAYVHDMGVSHRDLKPENILVASMDPPVVKITDFGLAKFSAQNSFLKTFCGTLSYLAPEVMQNRNQRGSGRFYSNRVDMWSLGCLAYVILTGYMPFDGNTQEDLYKGILSGQPNPRPIIDAGLSSLCQGFISSLLNVDPNERSDALSALNHPWITGFDSEDEANQSTTMGGNALPQSSMGPLNERFTQLGLTSTQFNFPPPPLDSGDSDEDSNDRFPLSKPEYFGVRSGYEEDPLSGVWMTLAVTPVSKPFKDIGIASDKLTIGRAPENGFCIENDQQISRQHCAIERRREPDGLWSVWFHAYSASCGINSTSLSPMTKVRIFDDDILVLYIRPTPPTMITLCFAVKFHDTENMRTKRVSKELDVQPIDVSDAPVKRKISEKHGRPKRHKSMMPV